MRKLRSRLRRHRRAAVSIGVWRRCRDVEQRRFRQPERVQRLPAVQGAPAGKVTFTVKNTGKVEHEFVVVKTLRPAGSLASHDGEASEAGNVGEIGSVIAPASRRS